MVYQFLADGFEIVEAMFPLDLLRRAGVEVATVGVAGTRVKSSAGVVVEADIDGRDFVLPKDAEMVLLPGGMPGTTNLLNSAVVSASLETIKGTEAYAGAICAAPWVLDANGMLDGKQATMFPTMHEHMKHGKFTGGPVEIDGKVITGRAAGVSLEFGLALVEVLRGKDAAEKVKNAIHPNF
ncbi:MAG: protein deglycase [Clostridiales bacterium]|jgi:4-methyl-5(b-hydroxyethyl)-thiazole monophosphate biosynthesis|nr:protein deglycase [Clostridiales bacterium]